MKILRQSVASVLLLFTSTLAIADAPGGDAALQLMDAMDMRTLLAQTIEQVTEAELRKNPALAPYRNVFLKFMNKHMGYDSTRADLAALYAEAFTPDELRTLAAFYRTPLGRKTVQKLPELIARGGQYGAQRVQDNLTELETMIAEESLRIQTLQAR